MHAIFFHLNIRFSLPTLRPEVINNKFLYPDSTKWLWEWFTSSCWTSFNFEVLSLLLWGERRGEALSQKQASDNGMVVSAFIPADPDSQWKVYPTLQLIKASSMSWKKDTIVPRVQYTCYRLINKQVLLQEAVTSHEASDSTHRRASSLFSFLGPTKDGSSLVEHPFTFNTIFCISCQKCQSGAKQSFVTITHVPEVVYSD